MTLKPKVLAREAVNIIADVLKAHRPFVFQIVKRLKTDGRIPATRPIAEDFTPQALARVVLALMADIASRATEMERRLGALPRVAGDGKATAAEELEALISQAAEVEPSDVDFWESEMMIGISSPVVYFSIKKTDGSTMSRIYRAEKDDAERLSTYARLPLRVLRLVAFELIESGTQQ